MKPSLYGKYPGKLKYDTKYIENCSEIELFIQVNKYYGLFHKIEYCNKMRKFYQLTNEKEMSSYFEQLIQKELEKSDILKKEPQEFLYTMDYCLLQTSRFGTKITYNPKGRIEITQEFKEWYQNWQNYILFMNNEEFAFFCTCHYEGKGMQYFELNNTISENDIANIQEKNNSYQLIKKNIKQSA